MTSTSMARRGPEPVAVQTSFSTATIAPGSRGLERVGVGQERGRGGKPQDHPVALTRKGQAGPAGGRDGFDDDRARYGIFTLIR